MTEEERLKIIHLRVDILLKVAQLVAIMAAGIVWISGKFP